MAQARGHRQLAGLIFAALLAAHRAPAQASVPIYSNELVNAFQNWSWANVNMANTSPVYSNDAYSISVSASDYSAVWLYHSTFNTAPYSNISFWINGGSGGQVISVEGATVNAAGDGVSLGSSTLPALTPNLWEQFTVPLAAIGAGNITNCNGFWFVLDDSGPAPTFYIDAVQLNQFPAPALTHITADAAQAVRVADSRWFGINVATWDSYLDTSTTISELNAAGWQCLRFPGGSESDEYNWATGLAGSSLQPTWFTNFAHVATNIGAQAVITANYGTGTPAEAAAWVAFSNVTNHYGFKYWEIGNELYGTWEIDSNTYPHDPYTYATRVQSYIQQMKAVDPTIKVGVVVTTGEDSDSNGYTSHPATNSATGQVHYGWTPVLMSTLKSLGVTPDFAIYHCYPQSGSDSDPLLLQGDGNWAGDAANLRGMISNYFGAGGANIELLCTENNSDSGPEGKQSVSLVNAIYYTDTFGQLMQTEFNSHLFWDLRNGEETDGDFDPTLYGWRAYGDLGVMNGLGTSLLNRYPQFFAAKLISYFVRGGDTVLNAASTYALLSAYAVRRTNGELTLLVVNKDSASNFTAQIALDNFSPGPAATIYSYGMTQDNAAESGNTNCDVAASAFSAATNFNYTFAPYSISVFVFAPKAPSLAAISAANQVVLQLSGQPGTPYVLQTSTNLANPSGWTSVSTNLLVTASLNITNTYGIGNVRAFWRAVWVP